MPLWHIRFRKRIDPPGYGPSQRNFGFNPFKTNGIFHKVQLCWLQSPNRYSFSEDRFCPANIAGFDEMSHFIWAFILFRGEGGGLMLLAKK